MKEPVMTTLTWLPVDNPERPEKSVPVLVATEGEGWYEGSWEEVGPWYAETGFYTDSGEEVWRIEDAAYWARVTVPEPTA